MDTETLLSNYACRGLFDDDKVTLSFWEVDRTVVGGVVPISTAVKLPAPGYLACRYFCQRRELGVMNLGGAGRVVLDGEEFALTLRDTLYVGRGTREVSFQSDDPSDPARFYLLSYPAHAEYPSMLVEASTIEPLELGSPDDCNERLLYKMICPGVVDSCQLVMGFTQLKTGSVWNTMPPHTHERRSEVYLYFGMEEGKAVFHMMGDPKETRHMILRNYEAALSPIWSIHSGVGVGSYSFVWGMGGENQEFTDMDGVAVDELR
ncbi:5-dehydro-4-deoxy-D-glucuronate isomerase [Pelagicoccus mobilis]|uniref:5-dehydro-4-deoxy-D-glucuronate isomerase n=1 Tax=Pelagicoccus mobilis TaxID=415221 RepID=A0A934RZF8_9BACT|nr:5-dehydro-4-deoxy-D-glucuronate isomerase [Pelagicoccus mobilis]MBK1878370.1 5-dehydro-4-deoxy-D-glucuronate isomerase [Pelagicoccus mobilis]